MILGYRHPATVEAMRRQAELPADYGAQHELEFALAGAAPIAAGVVVLIAGAMQFTSFKAHHLGCGRVAPGRGCTLPADAVTAWRHGLALGLHCCYCCAGSVASTNLLG